MRIDSVDTKKVNILYLEDDDGDFILLNRIVTKNFPEITLSRSTSITNMEEMLISKHIDILLLDLWVNSQSSNNRVESLIEKYPSLNIIIVSGQNDIDIAFKFVRQGLPYIVKGEHLEEDLCNVLSSLLKTITSRRKLLNIKKRLFNPEKFPIALISMDVSPKILFFFHDDFAIKNGGSMREFIMKLSIFTMTGIGQGESYAEGLYKLPVFDHREYELLVYSFRKKNRDHIDPRFAEGYVQILFFVPPILITLVSNFVELEKIISDNLDPIEDITDITEEDIHTIRRDIVNYLFKQHTKV